MRNFFFYPILLFLAFQQVFSDVNNAVANMSGCGLAMIHKSAMITTRYTPAPGAGLPVTFNISELPSDCYRIEAAYLWSVLSYTGDTPDPITYFVTNPEGASAGFDAIKVGQGIEKCWEETGTRGYRADITNIISGNGNYLVNANSGIWAMDGITMIILYSDLTAAFEGHFLAYDGLITNHGGSSSTDVTGLNVCENTSDAVSFFILSDIQNNIHSSFSVNINGVNHSFNSNFWNSELVPISLSTTNSSINLQLSNLGTDCYSWLLVGTYFRTQTCRNCPLRLDVNATANHNIVCRGDEVILNGEGGASYSWTSLPAGFSSISKSPLVYPTEKTRYIVQATSADGCIMGWDTVEVDVFAQPIADAGQHAAICIGTSATIGNTASNGTPPYSYSWSPAEGLSATNLAVVSASPSVTRMYYQTVVDANGCVSRDSVQVIVNPLPIANGGPPVETCFGIPVPIGNTASAGTPPYTYSWTPAEGLSATNLAVVNANPTISRMYYQTVTDANGCVSTDSVFVLVHQLPEPVIVSDGPTTFCSCDSVRLSVEIPYPAYLWSTGETTRDITIRLPGSYSVTVTDEFGCVNTSPPIVITVVYPQTQAVLGSNKALLANGETVEIPLYLRNATDLDFCNNYNWRAVIGVTKNTLYPVLGTAKGTIVDGLRYIEATGVRNSANDTLTKFYFSALLGDTIGAELQIVSFEWLDCPFNVPTFGTGIGLSDICYQGGSPRLIISNSPLSIIISPNPMEEDGEVWYFSLFDMTINVYIKNTLGETISATTVYRIKKGITVLKIDISNLPCGTYFLVADCEYGVFSTQFEVVK